MKAKLADGSLPRRISTASWPGKAVRALSGSALPNRCIVCDESRTQFRYNVQRIAFHERCRDIWEAEGGMVFCFFAYAHVAVVMHRRATACN